MSTSNAVPDGRVLLSAKLKLYFVQSVVNFVYNMLHSKSTKIDIVKFGFNFPPCSLPSAQIESRMV